MEKYYNIEEQRFWNSERCLFERTSRGANILPAVELLRLRAVRLPRVVLRGLNLRVAILLWDSLLMYGRYRSQDG
jgi:hypothetical protein